jgi:hypothetical protein
MNALTPITAAGAARQSADDGWDGPGWGGAALEYHAARDKRASIVSHSPEEIARLRRLMDDNMSLDRAWAELSRLPGAAAATVEALMFSLRSRRVQALGEPDVARRLAQLDNAQLREVAIRLQKPKPHMASAWSSADVQVLLTVRRKIDEQDA